MGRFLKALWYYVSGQFLFKARSIEQDPHVVDAQFEEVIRAKKDRFRVVKDNVGSLIGLRERRKMDLQRNAANRDELQETKEGAEALLQEVVAKLRGQGVADDQIPSNPEYMKYASAYQDASSSLEQVETEIARIEEDIEKLNVQAEEHKIQLQELQRELQAIERERHETIIDMTLSKQMADLNDALAGTATDGTAALLQSLRERRMKARGDATISRELAGTDAKIEGAKLRTKARQSRASTELAAKLGLKLGLKPVVTSEAPTAATPATPVATTAPTGGGKGGSLPS